LLWKACPDPHTMTAKPEMKKPLLTQPGNP